MLKTILLVAAAALALVLIAAATRPDRFRVERSAVVNAPPERLYALIDDMHAFNTWNPFARKDPGMKGSYTGPASGVGATHSWESDKVGSGRMEITSACAPNQVVMKLDFIKPFEAHNMARFTIAPEAGASRVTWAMDGPAPFVAKVMHLFFDMDKLVGKDFEDGLANLKTIAEAR